MIQQGSVSFIVLDRFVEIEINLWKADGHAYDSILRNTV